MLITMPRTLNPVRKALCKASLKQGNSIAKALKDAGYSKAYQRGHNNSTSNKVVNSCMAEIDRDIRKKVTVDNVLSGIELIKDMAIEKSDLSTAARCEELKGKYLAMFVEKNINENTNTEKKQELDSYYNRLLDKKPVQVVDTQ